MNDLSIYIHIPYCVRKCLYCDFLSFPLAADPSGTVCGNVLSDAADGKMISYVNLLRAELAAAAPQYNKYQVLSIFFGGGTPSLLPDGEIGRIMDTIRKYYHVAEDAEITIEMNPETVAEKRLREYITSGINRVSIGLQSADDDELERIGRIHDYGTFERAYNLAREADFRNINIDLMAALPGQSIASYRYTLEKAVSLAPEHISAYSLILEEGTWLYRRQAEYRFPSEEEDREMYLLTGEYLASCGYHRYEISNYAKGGCECRHNKVYWQRGNYAGFGPGAASMVENIRWTNPADMEQYRSCVENLMANGSMTAGGTTAAFAADRQILSLREQMEEYMFLGLRMMCGVSEQKFADKFGQPMEKVYGEVIEQMCRQGLLVREQGRVRLTGHGIDVSNYVMAQFLFDEIE